MIDNQRCPMGTLPKSQLPDNQRQNKTTLWLSDIFTSDGHASEQKGR